MLGLAEALSGRSPSAFLSFAEGGKCEPFLEQVRRRGFPAVRLIANAPRYLATVKEVEGHLRRFRADVLCCHGYKADILGLPASRWAGVPVVSVSRGWTAATFKVRLNEAVDRFSLRWMDAVVCVSAGQARKVRRAGVSAARTRVIHNAIRTERFDRPTVSRRQELQELFDSPRDRIVGAVGRLSPEKGFGDLVEAAVAVLRHSPGTGFVLFGEGPLRGTLAAQVAAHGLEGRFILAGFRDDVDTLLPHLDLLVLPSYTEGLPNVVLEAFASRVPVVATSVGGTPEVVDDEVSGYLVPAGSPPALTRRILDALSCEATRKAMGQRGRERVERDFTFEAQAQRYQELFESLTTNRRERARGPAA
jgi:glycosyltransferase involved in cell wall biosynthesis